MFWKLFNYIQGANNKEKKIPMTVPVTTHVTKTVSINVYIENWTVNYNGTQRFIIYSFCLKKLGTFY